MPFKLTFDSILPFDLLENNPRIIILLVEYSHRIYIYPDQITVGRPRRFVWVIGSVYQYGFIPGFPLVIADFEGEVVPFFGVRSIRMG